MQWHIIAKQNESGAWVATCPNLVESVSVEKPDPESAMGELSNHISALVLESGKRKQPVPHQEAGEVRPKKGDNSRYRLITCGPSK